MARASKNPPRGGFFVRVKAASGAEDEAFAVFVVHMDGAAWEEIAGEDALCQRVFQMGLDGAFQRACAKDRVVADFHQLVECGRADIQFEVAFGEAFFQASQLDFGDARHVFFAE